jgi:hypothetical protein
MSPSFQAPVGSKVTKISQENGLDSHGMVKPYFRVDFTVGPHGPFSERFEFDKFDAQSVRSKLQDYVTKIAAITA